MMKNLTGDMFSKARREEKLEQYTGVLSKLDELIDWAGLAAAVNKVTGREAARPQGGRPPYPTAVLLKIVVLQQLYGNLSDEQMEYALLDRLSWQRFIGMAEARDLPDARTLWAFKNLIAGGGGADALFSEVSHQLAQAGFGAKGGQLIDATIVEVPKTRVSQESRDKLNRGETPDHWSAKRIAHTDSDARWTMKHQEWFYGYKGHINADQQHKLIRAIVVTKANVDDRVPLEKLLETDPTRLESGKTIHADKGYDAQATRDLLKTKGLKDGVARKDNAQRYDQTDNEARNKALSRIRARVEHVFGGWEKTMGKRLRSIGERRARSMMIVQATVYNLRRLVTLVTGMAERGASAA
jgi:transposase, IS5 family